MLLKQDIENKLAEQKDNLLALLTSEIKLPITNIAIYSFDKNTFIGQLSLTIDVNKKQLLDFKFEDQSFTWDIDTIKSDLDTPWRKVFSDHQADIKKKICSDLKIDIDNAEKV